MTVVRSTDTLWYLNLPEMAKYHIQVSREWFKTLLKKICDKAGVTRADIGIVTGARAELYFDGRWRSVSFDAIQELAEKGTDIVFIEKQGIIDELKAHADKWGIALVNSRGYLTEYAHDLMAASKEAGANVIIMTDYDLSGVNLASKCPEDIPYITMDDTTLEYFNLDRDDPEISVEATNKKLTDHVQGIVETDPRFENVDINFLSEKRIEINAVLAKVGDERFWKFIMDKLDRLFSSRDYNRAIELPSEDTDMDETDLYPNATRKLILHIRKVTSKVVESTEEEITNEQSEVNGFLDVAEQKKKNKARVMKVIAQDKEISKIESEITRLCKLLNIDIESDDKKDEGSYSRPRKKSS